MMKNVMTACALFMAASATAAGDSAGSGFHCLIHRVSGNVLRNCVSGDVKGDKREEFCRSPRNGALKSVLIPAEDYAVVELGAEGCPPAPERQGIEALGVDRLGMPLIGAAPQE